MNILFVTHRYPPRTGGIETHVKEVATRLCERGHDVTVYSADAGTDVPTTAVVEGVHVRRFRSISPDDAFYVAPQITPAVYRFEGDVVHAHNYHALPVLFAALGVTDERFLVTSHYHGESATGLRNRLLTAYRPLGRWGLQTAEEVIAVSDWERERLRGDFGVDSTVIPNGVDVERFDGADPERRERPYLLCVGRLEEYKGVQHVIRALPVLSDYELVIAGTGPYQERLEQIARQIGVTDRVTFLGYVDDSRLPGLYAGATVHLQLSEFEAYGMTVGEALAAGTPCVVRRTGALSDWTTQTGVVGIADLEPDQVMRALKRAAEMTPDTDGVVGWDTVTDSLLNLYDHVARQDQ